MSANQDYVTGLRSAKLCRNTDILVDMMAISILSSYSLGSSFQIISRYYRIVVNLAD